MKQLLLSLLFFTTSVSGFAQHPKIDAGITLGYQKLGAKKWHDLIAAYNGASPETSPQSKFKGGFTYGAFVSYTIMEGITLTPEVNFAHFKSTSDDGTYPLELKAGFTDISLHGDIYILKFLPWAGIQPQDAYDRFHTRASLTYSMFSFSATGDSKGGGDLGSVSGAGGKFRFGLGLGYDFYVTDQISITPVFNLSYGSGTAQGLSDAILPAGTDGSNDRSAAFRRGIELKVAYTIKARKPLCPMPECRVAQEHRHPLEFGDVILRGNPHSLMQNPRHGQKHRGGDRKKLRKKLDKKEAKRKAKEEKERQKAEAEKAAQELEGEEGATDGEQGTPESESSEPEAEPDPASEPAQDPPSDDPDGGKE